MNAFFNRIYANNRLAVLFMLCVSAFFFIGLGHVHLFDWDEINFAESAREMIESGDYMRVQINYLPFWEKPPFFFWLQVGAMKLFGINEFAARFPNAVFGFIYLITFYFIGKKHFSAKFGMIWALLFFGALLPHIYFKSGIIDPVFNYFIFMSIYFMLMVIGKAESAWKFALLAGLFSGLSVITKGPVGFLLLGLTFTVYILVKRFKVFPKIKDILLFFVGLGAVVCIWLSIELYQNGWDIMLKFLRYQVELFNSNVAGHEQPFYYHFVVVFFGCFPISILALPSFRRKDTVVFDMQTWMLCLFWVVIIIFSITTTKIVHYSSMTYIPLAFLATLTITRLIQEGKVLPRWMLILIGTIGSILGIAIVALPILLRKKELLYPYINDSLAIDMLSTYVPWNGYEYTIGLLFITGIILFIRYARKGKLFKGIVLWGFNTAIMLLLVLFFIVSKIESFTQGPVIAYYEALKDDDCYIESFGYKSYAPYFYGKTPYRKGEPKSMDWYISGDIDKPVYMVCQSNEGYLDTREDFDLLRADGGFKLYRRMPPQSK